LAYIIMNGISSFAGKDTSGSLTINSDFLGTDKWTELFKFLTVLVVGVAPAGIFGWREKLRNGRLIKNKNRELEECQKRENPGRGSSKLSKNGSTGRGD
jgi:hypothetical protein